MRLVRCFRSGASLTTGSFRTAWTGTSAGYGGSTFLQLQHALPGIPDFLAQLSLGGFETTHGPALVLQVGQRLQTVFGLESVQVSLGLTELGVHRGPSRVGNFAGGIVGHGGVFDQRIQGVFFAQVFEEVFLSPAIKHPIGHLGGGQIPPGGQDGRLMAVLHKAGDLAQAQFAFEQAHLLVGQNVRNDASAATGPSWLKTCARDAGIAALAIGQQVKAGGLHLLKELGTVAAAIKDHRDAPFAHQGAHLAEDAGQHFDQTGVGLGGDDKQGIARTIVDPVIRSGRQRDAHARHMGLGQRVLAVVNPHMTVGVEETQGRCRARATRCWARAWPNWAARPAAARRASLRRSVLTSGARSNPSTRPKSWGEYSLRPSGRLMRQSAMSRSVSKLVRNP